MRRTACISTSSRLQIRLWIAGLVALFIATGVGWLINSHHLAAPTSIARHPSGPGPRSYADAMLELDRNVQEADEIRLVQSRQWIFEERYAQALIARGRLTGSFADYATAQAALDRAFAEAPEGAGPHLAQLALDFGMHRLARAEKMAGMIARYAVPDPITESEAQLTSGDIAFYRGNYVGALDQYRRIGGDGNDAGSLLRIAYALSRTGKPDEALALIDRCERAARLPSAQFLADLALRRGTIELQRGRWSEASRHFDRAARVFPGWWLSEAHKAQMLALTGQSLRAISAYLRIAVTGADSRALCGDEPDETRQAGHVRRVGDGETITEQPVE